MNTYAVPLVLELDAENEEDAHEAASRFLASSALLVARTTVKAIAERNAKFYIDE